MHTPAALTKRACCLILYTTCFLITHSASAQDGNLSPLLSVPLPEDDNCLVVPVKIRNRELLFLIDTGSSGMVLDASLRHELKNILEAKRMVTPGGESTIIVYESPSVRIGDIDLGIKSRAVCVDLNDIRVALGRDIRGLIGIDSLRPFVVTIDFDRHRLEFRSRIDMATVKVAAIPMTFNGGGLPCIPASANGSERPFVIDTGESGIRVEKDLIARLKRHDQLTAVGSNLSATALGRIYSPEYYGPFTFSVGGMSHKGLLFHESTESALGLSYLSRYKVTLDFPRSQLFLSKSGQFLRIDSPNISGLFICREDGHTSVLAVEPESPGYEAGIREGDKILKIDEIDSSPLSLFAIRKILRTEGRQVAMKLNRGGTVIDASLKLRKAPARL